MARPSGKQSPKKQSRKSPEPDTSSKRGSPRKTAGVSKSTKQRTPKPPALESPKKLGPGRPARTPRKSPVKENKAATLTTSRSQTPEKRGRKTAVGDASPKKARAKANACSQPTQMSRPLEPPILGWYKMAIVGQVEDSDISTLTSLLRSEGDKVADIAESAANGELDGDDFDEAARAITQAAYLYRSVVDSAKWEHMETRASTVWQMIQRLELNLQNCEEIFEHDFIKESEKIRDATFERGKVKPKSGLKTASPTKKRASPAKSSVSPTKKTTSPSKKTTSPTKKTKPVPIEDDVVSYVESDEEGIHCLWDKCPEICTSQYEMKTHILKKHPQGDQEFYLCQWDNRKKSCGFTTITPYSMKQHIWLDHLENCGKNYVGSVDEKWENGEPPIAKLKAEWQKKEVPAHMLKGDTRVSPLSGEEYHADLPPYYLQGDTVFSDVVASEQMHLDLANGARQLKSQSDFSEEAWEKARGVIVSKEDAKASGEQRKQPATSASSAGGSVGFVSGAGSGIFNAVSSVGVKVKSFISPTRPKASAPDARADGVEPKPRLTVWEAHKKSWKLPDASEELKEAVAKVVYAQKEETLKGKGKAPGTKRKVSVGAESSGRAGKQRRSGY